MGVGPIMDDPSWRMDEPGRYPATIVLGVLWIVVYATMLVVQGAPFFPSANPLTWGLVATPVAGSFGDLSAMALVAGEVWRPVTALSVHYLLVHLLLNLLGLILLGRLVESWYGTPLFLAIYVAIGGLGNLLAAGARIACSYRPEVHSAGGSTVIFGLMALIAIVGWRSRTEFGAFLRSQMLWQLLINGAIGVALISYIDNLGHLGGAIVGLTIGLCRPHPRRSAARPRARWWGVAAAIVLTTSLGAQAGATVADRRARAEVADDLERRLRYRLESDYASRQEALGLLRRMDALYRQLALKGRAELPGFDPLSGRFKGPSRSSLTAALDGTSNALRARPAGLDEGPTAGAFRVLLDLAGEATARPPTPGEVVRFEFVLRQIGSRAELELVGIRTLLTYLQSGQSG